MAEKRILAEFGPKSCVLEEPCRIHAARPGKAGEQPDWNDILRWGRAQYVQVQVQVKVDGYWGLQRPSIATICIHTRSASLFVNWICLLKNTTGFPRLSSGLLQCLSRVSWPAWLYMFPVTKISFSLHQPYAASAVCKHYALRAVLLPIHIKIYDIRAYGTFLSNKPL